MRALIDADDFLRARDLVGTTRCNINQVAAALHHLQKHHAVDAVIAGSTPYWFATPEDDDRSRSVEERTPERGPRRPRRRKEARRGQV